MALSFAIVEDAEMDLKRLQLTRHTSIQQNVALSKQLERRLRSCCWELIESDAFIVSDQDMSKMTQAEAYFMHRSLFEFFTPIEVWYLPELKMTDTSFDESAQLYWMELWLATRAFQLDASPAFEHLNLGPGYAKGIEAAANVQEAVRQFEELLRYTTQVLKFGQSTQLTLLRNVIALRNLTSLGGVILAIEMGLLSFVRVYEHIHGVNLSAADQNFPLPFHALVGFTWPRAVSRPSPVPHELLSYLLSAGCNPNREPIFEDRTAWQAWVEGFGCGSLQEAQTNAVLLRQFLKAVANITAAERVLGETLESRCKQMYGVGIPWIEVERKHRRVLGLDRNCFQPEDHAAVKEIGVELLDFIRSLTSNLRRTSLCPKKRSRSSANLSSSEGDQSSGDDGDEDDIYNMDGKPKFLEL